MPGLVNIGIVLAMKGKFDEALKSFDKSTTLYTQIGAVHEAREIEKTITLLKKKKQEIN